MLLIWRMVTKDYRIIKYVSIEPRQMAGVTDMLLASEKECNSASFGQEEPLNADTSWKVSCENIGTKQFRCSLLHYT